MYVVGVPSLPGVVLPTDATYPALTDPALTAWVTSLVRDPEWPGQHADEREN